MRRLLAMALVALVCVAAVPAARLSAPPSVAAADIAATARPFTPTDFAQLCKTDLVAALEMGLSKARDEIRGYECIFQKQERIGGTLGEVDVIRHAVREEPFAVTLHWQQGGGSARACLYARGENGGRMKVKTKFLLVTDTDPNGILPRKSSRYSIEDAGILNSMTRTHRACVEARHTGTLATEFLGTRPVAELNGRVCHVVKRICTPEEADAFRLSDGLIVAATMPLEAFRSVTMYFDAERGLQIGSELRRTDGELIGAYWFRDVVLNPAFPADQFTPAVLKR